jgi:isoquinoline 1-oxidoreductase beta subunit
VPLRRRVFVRDALELSTTLRRPVQVVWTREDEIQHDDYRPAGLGRWRGGPDLDGMPVLSKHQSACPSILSRGTPEATADDVDRTAVEGAADLPYAMPNIGVEYGSANTPVTVAFSRAVGSSETPATECFVDALAAAGGQDTPALRRRLPAAKPRHLGVWNLAAEQAGWDSPCPAGRNGGIAVAESFGSYVAQVADVSVSERRRWP